MNELIKCQKCGNEFPNNGLNGVCPDCRRRNTPRTYFIIAITIIILGFVGGIILGNTNKVEKGTYNSYSEDFDYEESFNTDLMISSWVGSALFSIIIFGIGSTNYRLNLIIDNKRK